ncbi:MAG TPA: beta-sandwich domain-containing protein [Candidatus Wunengus sp. YC60]|uniref:beta-sandwich domain-containing protein n=1 Tax=Candidatus Wunengus sp. YC60 TaxID=3367697 RepID=UPI0040291CC2
MFTTKRIYTKTQIIVLSAFFIMASLALHAFAEEKGLGTIQGTVKAKKAKYIKDSIAYIENVTSTFEPQKEHAVMDQKNMAFIPHVLPLLKGTTVDFLNSDMVQHNIYSPDAVADNMNLGTWLKGEVRPFTFNKLGVASMRCNVHVDMLAYVLVLQNSYFARVNNDGSFSITNVPEGKYTLKLWNERYKAEDRQIEVKANAPAAVEFELK